MSTPAAQPGTALAHPCPVCDRRFTTQFGVMRHLGGTHKLAWIDAFSGRCAVCGARVGDHTRMLAHLHAAHPEQPTLPHAWLSADLDGDRHGVVETLRNQVAAAGGRL